jgi:type I restriction enzyme R subunit
MSEAPEFPITEAGSAQLQALHTLSAMGWRYLPRARVDALRGHRRGQMVLDDVLRQQLAAINRISPGNGRHYLFSEENLQQAIQKLRDQPYQGLLRSNEVLTDLLQLGTSLPQKVEDLQRDWSLRYIDWQDWHANAFHMTAELPVETRPGQVVRPDIVLYVNGIPFVVIEAKRSGEAIEQGISQQLRNQKPDDGAPGLFYTVQLVVAAHPAEPRYATVGTPAKLWSAWQEQDIAPERIQQIVNQPFDPIEFDQIFEDFEAHRRRHLAVHDRGGRMPTPLDELLVGLCSPERVLEFARRFILFDGPYKQIARHPQYFTVKHLMQRVQQRDDAGRRTGGVVWHTQGSGKSLTMVMLAKSLAMGVSGARIVMVTDRTDLDTQIRDIFRATGLQPKQASSGEHLLDLLEQKEAVITTLIQKFRAGLNKRKLVDPDPNLFVLTDESHRSQYGDIASFHARMRDTLPNACLIGFTGTPLAKKERNTFLKFGPLVKPAYTLQDAVREGAVVPLLYEGRMVEQDVNAKAIDAWFERTTRPLSEQQCADLKRRMSRASALMNVSDWMRCVVFDASRHFADNFQGSGLKAQLVAPSKRAAVLMQSIFAELDEVKTEVVISPPDEREDENSADESEDETVKAFWKKMMALYGTESAYNSRIIEAFKGPGGPEMLIVVSKLLTGFDAPRNTVLYLARPLKEHTLLQAIARVNRVFDEEGGADKPFGYVIDYCGILKDLDKALAANAALLGFEEEDLAGTLTSLRQQAEALPQLYAALLSIFDGVANRYDEEPYARHLANPEVRGKFYAALTAFLRALQVAQASRDFIEATPKHTLERWRESAQRFELLRAHAYRRYAERIDWADYRPKVQKLLDQHVTSHEVSVLIEPLDIFDDPAIERARKEHGQSDASVADEIAHRTLRTADEKWEEDPAHYERFSKLVKDTIAKFREHRLSEKTYLQEVLKLRDGAIRRREDDAPVPASIRGKGHETAFWGIVQRELQAAGIEDGTLAVDLGVEFVKAVERCRIVGWQNDRSVENRIRSEIDAYYFDTLGAPDALSPQLLDKIVDDVLETAKVRMPDDGRSR